MNPMGGLPPADAFDAFFGPALFVPGARSLLQRADPRPGERVLDLACGTGTLARHVAPAVGPGGAVVAVDINPGMLSVARAKPAPGSGGGDRGARIDWMLGSALALAFDDGSFDLVLCQQGLQFFPDRVGALREVRRVLRPGGRIALNVWQPLGRHPAYEALCTAEARFLRRPLYEVASPWTLTDAAAVHALLDEARFSPVDVGSVTFEARFPSAERFVYLTLFAASAFMPNIDWEDATLRSSLVETVGREAEPVIRQFRSGAEVAFPVHWHVAVAHTPLRHAPAVA